MLFVDGSVSKPWWWNIFTSSSVRVGQLINIEVCSVGPCCHGAAAELCCWLPPAAVATGNECHAAAAGCQVRLLVISQGVYYLCLISCQVRLLSVVEKMVFSFLFVFWPKISKGRIFVFMVFWMLIFHINFALKPYRYYFCMIILFSIYMNLHPL